MVKITCVCTECADVITDPLCVRCFEREVFAWLGEQQLSSVRKLSLTNKIVNLMNAAKQLSFSDFNCIVCRRKMQNICAYCLMKNVSELFNSYLPRERTELIFNHFIHDFGLQREKRVFYEVVDEDG